MANLLEDTNSTNVDKVFFTELERSGSNVENKDKWTKSVGFLPNHELRMEVGFEGPPSECLWATNALYAWALQILLLITSHDFLELWIAVGESAPNFSSFSGNSASSSWLCSGWRPSWVGWEHINLSMELFQGSCYTTNFCGHFGLADNQSA
eukprot:Gb_15451 [translate_table: standard]